MDQLSREELQRYSRHIILPEVGLAGQLKLANARVLLIGAGGLGSPIALYLAAAGVGHLGVVDFDVVDATNLHRQVIHGTSDVGRPKLDSLRDKLKEINPHVVVTPHNEKLVRENALEIISQYDCVIDGTDNFATRYLVNDACCLLDKPNFYGSIFRFDGQATVFCTPNGPCYRCLFPEPPPPGVVPSCAEGGVIGVLPGTIGLIQATEAIKWILGIGQSLVGRLVLYDAMSMRFDEIQIKRDPDCPICGENPSITELINYDEFCGVTAQPQNSMPQIPTIEPNEVQSFMDSGQKFILIDVREPDEVAINSIPGSVKIPLGEVPDRMSEIPKEGLVVMQCRSGARSGQACEYLMAHGYDNVKNMRGGILAWIAEVDPSLPTY